MSDLQHSISEEYVPNQPIEAQFFLPDMATAGIAGGDNYTDMYAASSLRAETDSGSSFPLWAHVQAGNEMNGNSHQHYPYSQHMNITYNITSDNQVVPTMPALSMPRAGVGSQREYTTDYSTYRTDTAHSVMTSRADNFYRAPVNIVTHGIQQRMSCHDTAKSLKDSLSTWRMRCVECSRRFNSHVTLQNHIDSAHKGIRPFKCEVCGKTFAQSATLRTHSRVHTGEKPYKCDICNRQFADLSTCKKHQRVHDGQKPYECPICNKRFSQSGNMIRHKESHERKDSKFKITTVATTSMETGNQTKYLLQRS